MDHTYEVVVCDMFGIAYGQIAKAVPTQIMWELNGMGSASIDFPILDLDAMTLLPRTCLPGGREVQIWRDQVLIWWGWPISATFDRTSVHLSCSGLLWPISKRFFGPIIGNGLLNPSFEFGTTDPIVGHWASSAGATTFTLNDATLGQPVLEGRYAAKLVGAANNSGLNQLVEITVAVPTQIDISAWAYIDPNGGSFTPSADNKGLRVDVINSGGGPVTTTFDPIQASEKIGQWNLHQLSITLQPGTWEVFVILAALPAGWIVWDKCVLASPQEVGVFGALGTLVDEIIAYAQDPNWGKTPLALPTVGSPARIVNSFYQLYDNGNILDALNEFPTAGWMDFDIVYGGAANGDDSTDAQGHFRIFRSFEPAKGSIKWNYPVEVDAGTVTDISGSVDGSQVGTGQRVLSQGTSAGAATDLGYAAFAAGIGPGTAPGGSGYSPNRSATDGAFVADSDVITASLGFTSADIGKPVWSLSGALPAGATIASIISATQAHFTVTLDPFGSSRGALKTVSGDSVGIGGHMVENSTSQVANQTVGTLDPLARFTLVRQLAAQVLPTLKQRAEGFIGQVFVGDVVPVNIQLGWVGGFTELMRIAQMTLYPPTEEVALGLNVVNSAPPS